MEPGLVAADVCCDHLELSVHVFDRPAGRAGGEHGLALLAKLVSVGAKLGQVGGIRLEVGTAGALGDRIGVTGVIM